MHSSIVVPLLPVQLAAAKKGGGVAHTRANNRLNCWPGRHAVTAITQCVYGTACAPRRTGTTRLRLRHTRGP